MNNHTDDLKTNGNQSRIERAETRTEQAEARTDQAKARTEAAETRTGQAETRTEQAKTRAEQAETRAERAETRTEQAETLLELLAHKEVDLQISRTLPQSLPANSPAGQEKSIENLTTRQRDILRLVAEGQNTKQIAALLQVSPKTVEYHRLKLMDCLNVHNIPGLVRFALRVGLIPPERLVSDETSPGAVG